MIAEIVRKRDDRVMRSTGVANGAAAVAWWRENLTPAPKYFAGRTSICGCEIFDFGTRNYYGRLWR